MDSNFFNQPKNDEVMKDRILKGMSNATDLLKSDVQNELEDLVKKGEVEVVSMDDIKETYGNQFWKGEDVSAIEDNIEALIKKGEDEFLEEDEWNALEKAMADIKLLEKKAIAVPFRDGHTYREVYVQKAESTEAE